MKKLVTMFTAFTLVFCLSITAYAEENSEQSKSSEYVVLTLDELQAAISSAEDGDEIIVAGQICFEDGEYCIGDPEKTVILTYDGRMSKQKLFLMGNDVSKITLQNLILKGGSLNYNTVIEMANSIQEVALLNTTIQGFNCYLHPINNMGVMTVDGCTFKDNSGRYAGHIKNEQGQLTITNSYFSGGISETAGGAIQNFANLSVSGSVFESNIGNFGGAISTRVLCEVSNSKFTGNIARFNGGAIINNPDSSSVLIVTDCEIYDNSAVYYGNDICNEKDMTIQYTKALSDIYTSTERVPYGWQSDSPENIEGTPRTEYTIPLVTSRDNDGTLYIRFAFEDEIVANDDSSDGADGDTPTMEIPPSETTSPDDKQSTDPPDEKEDTVPTTPDNNNAENTPEIPSEKIENELPIIPDNIAERPTIPDTIAPSTPPADDANDTTPTGRNEQPTTPENTDPPIPVGSTESNGKPPEEENSTPIDTTEDNFSNGVSDYTVTEYPTETTSVITEKEEDLERADSEITTDSSNDGDSSDIPKYLSEFYNENEEKQKTSEYDTAMLAKNCITNNAKLDEIHRIASGILVINMIEVAALIGFVVWLKQRQK